MLNFSLLWNPLNLIKKKHTQKLTNKQKTPENSKIMAAQGQALSKSTQYTYCV